MGLVVPSPRMGSLPILTQRKSRGVTVLAFDRRRIRILLGIESSRSPTSSGRKF